jgi:3-oxoacyl-[acyl-carrier protein] reductase
MKLEGKVALITGASTGFGAATAKLFGSEGATVVINYPNASEEDNATRVAAEIAKSGGKAFPIRADVSNWDQVAAMVTETKQRFGSLDILMNNAAVNSYKALHEVTLEEWNRTIAVDLTGVFICVRHCLPVMIEQKKGNIISIASIAPWFASRTVDYNAAKAGVIAITRTIAPGFHRTEMGEMVRQKIGIPYLDTIPVGFTPGPDSLAKVALFLASEDSHYIHGHTLISDGGISMR